MLRRDHTIFMRLWRHCLPELDLFPPHDRRRAFHRASTALASAMLLGLAGCPIDLLCLILQETTLRIVDSETGNATTNAVVTFALRPTSPHSVLSDDERLDQSGVSARTDENGRVLFTEESFILCGGGPFPFVGPRTYPDPLPDFVTGTTYLVRVETETASEILTVEFTTGNTLSGEFFEVTVVTIDEPVQGEDVGE